MTPNPNPSPELLPCPFCGGEELSHGFASGGGVYLGTVQCHTDGCGAAFTMDSGEDEAIAAWNTRAGSDDARLRDRIAVLERENANYAKTMEIIGQLDSTPAALSPQALPAPGEVERPGITRAWAGGDSAPDDWDGGPVKARNGKTVYTPAYWQHRPKPEWSGQWDIVAYTPTLATVAAANDEGVWQLIETAPRDGALFLALYRDNGLFVYALTHYRRNRDGTEGWYDGTIPAANLPLAWQQLPNIDAAIRLLSQGEGA